MAETDQPWAFKEWAGVVGALGAGEQAVILRKGGIHERGGKFRAEHAFFYLFPTFEHQNPEDLNERGLPYLDSALKELRGNEDFLQKNIPVRYAASFEEAFHVTDFDRALSLSPYHVLSEQAVRKRFEWGDEKGIYVLLVRVEALKDPPPVPRIPAYGGCRSWVKLGNAPGRTGAAPVMADERFEKLRREITGLLKGGTA